MSPDMIVPHNESNGFFMHFSFNYTWFICPGAALEALWLPKVHFHASAILALATFNMRPHATSRFFRFFSSAEVNTRKLGK